MFTSWTREKVGFLGAYVLLVATPLRALADTSRPNVNPVNSRMSAEHLVQLDQQLRDWYVQAAALHDAERLDEARVLYQQIWQHRRTYDVATALAEICVQKQQFAQAAHYYEIALQRIVPSQGSEFIDQLVSASKAIQARVTKLDVSATPHQVNGLTITDTSTGVKLDQPIYLEPGETHLRASAPGFKPQTTTILSEPGRRFTWEISWQAEVNAAAPRMTHAATSADATHNTGLPWLVVPVGALLTAGLATGSILSFREGKRKHRNVQALELTADECSDSPTQSCADASRLKDSGQRADTLGWVFAGGAVAAALSTAVVWWLWEPMTPVEVQLGVTEGTLTWRHDW